MTQRHISIAAATLAALVVGIDPAAAQTSTDETPSVTGTAPGGSSVTVSPNVSPNTDVSPSTNIGTGSQSSPSDSSTTVNPSTTDQSPSASPPMGNDKVGDDKAKPDDRDRMKDQEQVDKKTGLDRADQAAGPHGEQGRDNARTRGNRQY